jgi:hypothetical protein
MKEIQEFGSVLIIPDSFLLTKNNLPDRNFTIGYITNPPFSSDYHQFSTAVDHTASNTPDPIRTPQLSDARPGQY